jgi:DNA-binding PadR family transcriptional regulator
MENKFLKQMRRRIVKNFLDTLFLAELKKNQPQSAYALMNLVHRKFGFLISAGTVYALLYSMERKELVIGEPTENKRIYRLTQKGNETIDILLKTKEELFQYAKTIF